MEKRQFDRFVHLLYQHLDKPDYSIMDLCRELGMSRSQLSRLVKEQSGLTLSLYIRRCRLEKARELLQGTDLRILEVTDAVGIDSPQTFTKYFTQEFGLSPTEYRRQLPAPPTLLESLTPEEPEEALEELPGAPMPSRWLPWIWGMGAGLLLAVAIGLYVYLHPSVREDRVGEASIAILPFTYRGDAADSLLAGGLRDQVHASLTSLEQIIVISKTSTVLFQNSPKNLSQIAEELGVRYLLTGTVLSQAQNLHVSVELIRADENRTVWANAFDGEVGQGIKFMNAVTRQITEALDRKLSAEESRRMNRLPTRNLQAYNAYLLGLELMKSRSQEKMRAAIRQFDRALARDSTFADALANKALAYYLLGSDGHMALLGGIQLAEQNALAAIRLDSENALAYATLANGYWRLNKPEQALTTFQIALKHSPNDALITYWYSLALRSLGRFDEAIYYGNRALTLDPLYPTIIAGHVGNYSYAGRFKEAWQLIQDSEPLLDGFYMYYYVRAFYYLNQQDHRQALREFMKSDSLNPGYQVVTIFTLYCRAQLGERAPAEVQLRALTDIPDHYAYKAILYAGLRDRENCLRYLELGAPLGIMPEYLKISPLFRFLHGDPRFQQLLQQLGLA